MDRVEVRTEGIQDYLYSSSAKFHKVTRYVRCREMCFKLCTLIFFAPRAKFCCFFNLSVCWP